MGARSINGDHLSNLCVPVSACSYFRVFKSLSGHRSFKTNWFWASFLAWSMRPQRLGLRICVLDFLGLGAWGRDFILFFLFYSCTKQPWGRSFFNFIFTFSVLPQLNSYSPCGWPLAVSWVLHGTLLSESVRQRAKFLTIGLVLTNVHSSGHHCKWK